jgi:hypothetical protein
VATIEAKIANETDRGRDFNEAKSTAIKETAEGQMRYVRWAFEIESRERKAVAETLFRKNSDLPTNTKSL